MKGYLSNYTSINYIGVPLIFFGAKYVTQEGG